MAKDFFVHVLKVVVKRIIAIAIKMDIFVVMNVDAWIAKIQEQMK